MNEEFSFLKKKKVIVFDLDGTIVNLTADWATLKNILREKYDQIYKERCGFRSMSACLSEIVRRHDDEILQNFIEIIRNYEDDNIKNIIPIDETVYFIKNNKQFGIDEETKFAILSLNTQKTIKKSLDLTKISSYFDILIGREDVRKWKPEPEGLLKIKDYFNVENQDMVFFGDLETDIKTGKRAGIDVYYIDVLINYVKSYIT